MANKLKPCPFCGEPAFMGKRSLGCDNSGCHFSPAWAANDRNSMQDCIAAWNTRPVEDALAGALKFVQEHCQLYGAADAAREKIDAALRKAGVL